jgi:RHS repeat-associated protein
MQGNLFGFSYNDRSQLTQLTSPGSVVEALGYEADGWLSQRSIVAPYGTVLDETLTMDGRGKVTDASTTGIVGTGARAAYSGLGNLVASEWTRSLVPQETEHWRMDALGNPYWYRRYTDGPDPETRYSYESGSHALLSTESRNPDICGSMAVWTEEVSYDYDMAGSGKRELGTTYSDAQCIQSPIRTRDVRSYYSADGKLRVFQRAVDSSVPGQRRIYEEYRYDALGRRVFLRSRPDSACSDTYCNDLDATERYVWDGDQLLIEDRSDAASHGGRVAYTHGGAIDRPLAVYKDGTAVVPHATWRGVYVSGTFSNGTSAQYSIEWPGQSMYAYLNTPPHDRQSWWGSLIRGSQDNSGLMYRRNRYYDPATGRFTQEDPIGLVGGLNLYGYAGGDPVSYSDPFGLCPYAGEKRNTDLNDCPDDERLSAFKVLNRNQLGRSFIQVIADRGIDVDLHDGPIDCGGRKAGACSSLIGKRMTLNDELGAVDMASTVVHETQHFVNFGNITHDMGSFSTDEIHAYAAGFTFLNTLPASMRASAAYGPWAAAYKKNPRAGLRKVCKLAGYTDCP